MDKEEVTLILDKKLFPIVPLKNYSKVPNVKWENEDLWIKSKRDFQETLNKADSRTITGYSLLTGRVSGIMVIDIDKNHGDGSVDGLENFKKFIQDLSRGDKEQILNTLWVQTPRGGHHLYFRYKEGLKSKANYIEGIDVRTDGGLIVLPNSKVRINDRVIQYKSNDDDIEEMPQSLFNKLLEVIKPRGKHQINQGKVINEIGQYVAYEEGKRNQELFKEVIDIISKSSIRDINIINSISQGLNLLKCKHPLEIEEVHNIVNSVVGRLNPSYCNNKGNIDNWELVQYIKAQRPSYKKGNLWFIYDSKKGFYDYMEIEQLQRMYFDYAINNKDKTVSKSKNFADLLMVNSENAKDTYHEKDYINCLNGVIDINNNQLIEHDPKYKLQVQFKANYIKDWKEKFKKSKFKRFLDTTLDNEDIPIMQQAFGLFLSPHAREVEKVFLLKGSGSDGKSVMFDIMESLIDKRYISGVGLGDFGQEFIISMIEGKHANIVRDDDFERTIHKHFKSIATGEEVPVNRKNKDHVRLAFNVTMLFGLNGLPNSKDKSFGFFRRPIIIQFDNTFGTEKEVKEGKTKYLKDPTISRDIINNELDIVFNWAYEGLQKLKSSNWSIEPSKKSIEEMEQYREETDTVYAFYRNYITEMLGNKLMAKKLYEDYLGFCKENYIETPVTMTTFGKQMKCLGVEQRRGNQGKYYVDITTDFHRAGEEEDPF